MHSLMLSWEFPPKIVGGIARHVYDLSLALLKQGVDVTVITCDMQGAAKYEEIHGIKVHRVPMSNPSPPDFLTWVLQLNLNMIEQANRLAFAGTTFDVIHAHDWLAGFAGKNLKHTWKNPLVATIHATEFGRNNGLYNELQRYISNVEWWLGYESWRVICCSLFMRDELQRVFQMPDDKIRVIPNGVYPEEFAKTDLDPAKIRNQYCAPDEKIIFYVGRIVREKGLGVLLDAFSRVLVVESKAKLVIAGTGPYMDELKHRAYCLGIFNRIYFTGYIDDNTRNALYKSAAVAVFPSLYEPFGIVALEGMAAGTPVVVSDAGGMSEIIEHGVNGLKAYCNNASSLADNIIWVLQHPDHAGKIRERALNDIQKIYNWDRIAAQTIDVYREILDEYHESNWRAVMHEEAARDMFMSRMVQSIGAEEMSRYRDVH
ncbi:MAG TPA: glycosyltransferase family 4 protein [Bacillota bacterium]